MRIGNTIYLDHQATTSIDEYVLSAMEPFYAQRFGNPHSENHALGWDAAKAVEVSKAQISSLLGASDDEVFFTSGATEANNMAILGLARNLERQSRRRILVTAIEHKCVLAAAQVAQDQCGCSLEFIPIGSDGRIDMDWLAHSVDEQVLLISVIAVNNEIGTIQNLAAISEIAREHGVLFHTDIAQGPVALDMSTLAETVDLASLSAHKFHGPKGVGCLYIERSVQSSIEPLIYGGGQQGGLRSGTVPVPLVVGMGEAARRITSGECKDDRDHLAALSDRLLKGLEASEFAVWINGSTDNRHPGNLNIGFEGFDAEDILLGLQPHLAASTGAACTTGIPEPSHVLRAIGLSESAAGSSIRFSPGRHTTEQDIDEAIDLIIIALKQFSSLHAKKSVG